MEKVCRKSALKASPIPRFNLGNSPKTANACKRLKQDHDKVNLIFFLHAVPSYGQDHKNKKDLELVTSPSLSCKKCLEKFLFWSGPLNLETVERKGKKR